MGKDIIDGIYENSNPYSEIDYVIDEARFGVSYLRQTRDGRQMSNTWLKGTYSGNNRILKAIAGDYYKANTIMKALAYGKVDKVITRVHFKKNIQTFRLDANGYIKNKWP